VEERRKTPALCPDHTALVQAIGRIEGAQQIIALQGSDIKTSLGTLSGELKEMRDAVSNMKIQIVKDEVKIKPVYWVIGTAGVAGISGVVQLLYKFIAN
jgi:hypothetical protein